MGEKDSPSYHADRLTRAASAFTDTYRFYHLPQTVEHLQLGESDLISARRELVDALIGVFEQGNGDGRREAVGLLLRTFETFAEFAYLRARGELSQHQSRAGGHLTGT